MYGSTDSRVIIWLPINPCANSTLVNSCLHINNQKGTEIPFQIIGHSNLETMPLTLEDVMDFMMKDKQERNVERESDKQEIRQLITEGVKNEVKAAIEPMQERQSQLESVQEEMIQQFKGMIKEVKDIKEHLESSSADSQVQTVQPTVVQPVQSGSQPRVNNIDGVTHLVRDSESGDKEAKVREIIFRSRRTLGLYRIGQDDLDRMKLEQYGGARSE